MVEFVCNPQYLHLKPTNRYHERASLEYQPVLSVSVGGREPSGNVWIITHNLGVTTLIGIQVTIQKLSQRQKIQHSIDTFPREHVQKRGDFCESLFGKYAPSTVSQCVGGQILRFNLAHAQLNLATSVVDHGFLFSPPIPVWNININIVTINNRNNRNKIVTEKGRRGYMDA